MTCHQLLHFQQRPSTTVCGFLQWVISLRWPAGISTSPNMLSRKNCWRGWSSRRRKQSKPSASIPATGISHKGTWMCGRWQCRIATETHASKAVSNKQSTAHELSNSGKKHSQRMLATTEGAFHLGRDLVRSGNLISSKWIWHVNFCWYKIRSLNGKTLSLPKSDFIKFTSL